MACDRCDQLARELRETREELAEYRRLGGSTVEDDTESRLHLWRKALGCHKTETRLLLILVERAGRVVSYESLVQGMWAEGARDEPGDPLNVIKCRLVFLRRRLASLFVNPPVKVETAWGCGLTISKAAAAHLVDYVERRERLGGAA